MMTRSQGKLQAHEPRANTRRRQIKLKTPIQPRSLSDSCSSSAGPGEPRKKRKSLPANMPKKGKQQVRHEWPLAEEMQAWEYVKELPELWSRKMELYKILGDKLNDMFRKDGYVTLDQNKVKDKFNNFRGRYAGGQVSADDPLYKEYSGIMSSFFTSGAGTSSSSVSVGGSTKTKKKMSSEEQHASALKHLISNNIGGAILFEYSGILRFADVLELFFHFENFEGQISFLNSILEERANGNVPRGM